MSALIETQTVVHSPQELLDEHLLAESDRLMDLLPVAIYVCDRDGVIVRYNRKAAEFWGRSPRLGDPAERFCGSVQMYRLDGGLLPHSESPVAEALRTGVAVRDQEVVIERPNGSRIIALVNVDPLRDGQGGIVGAVNCFQDVTERRRAQAELRAHDRRWRELLQALPEAVYTTDAAGRITFYNEAAADLWGHRPELGKSEWCGSWRLYWPDGRPMPHDECPMAVALKEGRAIRGAEAVAERPDGTRVPFVPHPTPLFDASGVLTGGVNMLVDITERKRAEERLRENDARFSAIVGQVTAGVAQTDLTGRFVLVNERYCDIVGYTEAELLRMRMQDITHPEDLPRNMELFQELVRTGKNFVIEKGYVRKDGALVWVNNSVSGVKDASGRLSNIAAVSIDITERKQAEEVGAQLASIIETSDDAIVSKDLNGVIRTWNKGAERLFGYKAEEVVGKPVTILIPPDRHDEEPGILERIRRGERVEHYETVRMRKDGSLIDISLSVSPVKNADGMIAGASKIARDITDRRRSQELQTLLLREMSHRVKNLFAVAGGVVALSARSARTPDDMARAVRERLAALARAQELTLPDLDKRSEAPDRATTLHALVRTIVLPYVDPERERDERVVVDGPDVPIGGSAVTSLALLLHELATNAAKYGALSSPTGGVNLSCSVEKDELLLTWNEHGGPRLNGSAESEGFGSLLARRTVTSQFGGRIDRDWQPEGLIVRLSLPLERLTK